MNPVCFRTCFSSKPIKTLALFFYLHAVLVFLFVLVAVLSFTTPLSRWSQLLPRRRGRRWAAQSSEFGVSAVNTRMSVQNNTSKTSGRFPLTTITRPREQTLNFLWVDKSLWLIRDSSSWLIASFCIFSFECFVAVSEVPEWKQLCWHFYLSCFVHFRTAL